ncbi:MAG TPA: hypothetical protein VFJ58_28635 [Armatimonadota bacterium]|nr:hypothetical protein [Armatimonadota bacterium]
MAEGPKAPALLFPRRISLLKHARVQPPNNAQGQNPAWEIAPFRPLML